MKSKQKEEIKEKSIEELRKLIKEGEGLLFKLRFEKSQNKMKNLKSIFWERKKIALALTIINQKNKLQETAEKEKVEAKVKPKARGRSNEKR